MMKKWMCISCIFLLLSGCEQKEAAVPMVEEIDEKTIQTAHEQGIKVAKKMLKDSTKQQTLIMEPQEEEAGIYDSKIGGTPYLPPGFDYPYNKNPGYEQQPLILLAQFNFDQFPENELYPEHGILQLYISDLDWIYGMDYENPTNDAAFRVVYFDTIETNTEKLQQPPELNISEDFVYPANFSLKLSIKNQEYATIPEKEDYRPEAAKAYQELFHKPIDMDSHYALYMLSGVDEGIGYTPSRFIKNPYYIQGDPRSAYERMHYNTVLALFQPDLSDEFMFADGGCAIFMINKDDLKQADFSDVYYTWDCF